jgi:hypothetical protein
VEAVVFIVSHIEGEVKAVSALAGLETVIQGQG